MKCNNSEEIKLRKEKEFCDQSVCCRSCNYKNFCGLTCDLYEKSLDLFCPITPICMEK